MSAIYSNLGERANSARPPRLLDRMRQVLRTKHYAYSTEQAYVQWARRYILFHDKRHPQEMGGPEIESFLTHLAVEGRVSASTQTQALCQKNCRDVQERVALVGITSTKVLSAMRSNLPPVVLDCSNESLAMHFDILLQRIFSNRVPTSAQCRNYWATKTFPPR